MNQKKTISAKMSATDVAGVEVFSGLDADAQEACASLGVRRSLSAGRLIFSQGEPGARFHALLSGWVRISQAGPEGEQTLIRFIGPGELFGAFAIFTEGAYPAEGIAASESVEISWSEPHIRQLIERYPRIAMNMVALAGRRLAELQERLREIATQPAEQRIANALLRLAERSHRVEDGAIELEWPLTRKDIAALSATTLYTASRLMARWQRQNIVRSVGRRISVLAAHELARVGGLPDPR